MIAMCYRARRNLAAWVDGELPQRECERLAAHVADCAACASQALAMRRTIEHQRRWLPEVVDPGPVASGPLYAHIEATLAQPRGLAIAWRWPLRPVMAAMAAGVAVVAMVILLVGGPTAVLIPLGVEPPPVEVSTQPELFTDYGLIQHLDALENFDSVEAVQLDQDSNAQSG